MPRDRDSSFEPKIVAKRQRRLTGVDDVVISLSAKGLTHGGIAAHLAEVYDAEVSRQTISTITDRVMEGMAEWQSRPLDAVYAVVFIDAINVKIREGQVQCYCEVAYPVLKASWSARAGMPSSGWLPAAPNRSSASPSWRRSTRAAASANSGWK